MTVKNSLLEYIKISLLLFLILLITFFLFNISSNFQHERAGNEVMKIEEVAEYLSITQGTVIDIIKTEESELKKQGSYSGLMFPYYKINDEYYFYKSSVDNWLEEISTRKLIYDLQKRNIY